MRVPPISTQPAATSAGKTIHAIRLLDEHVLVSREGRVSSANLVGANGEAPAGPGLKMRMRLKSFRYDRPGEVIGNPTSGVKIPRSPLSIVTPFALCVSGLQSHRGSHRPGS